MSDRLLPVEARRIGPGSTAGGAGAPSSRGILRSSGDDRRGINASSSQRCDFCGVDIDNTHSHLFDRPKRSLVCVCRSCYGLFTNDGAGGTRFRAVPQRYVLLPAAAHAAPLWNSRQIPNGLSILFTNGGTGLTTAYYPGRAEATEAALPLDAWRDIEQALPELATMAHDVEALLVRRTDTSIDAAIVPIDACYQLLGRIRQTWRAHQGEDDVGREVEAFFSRISDLAHATAV